jgi:hypothetical protein
MANTGLRKVTGPVEDAIQNGKIPDLTELSRILVSVEVASPAGE